MCCTTSETEDDAVHVNQYFITYRSKAVVLLWFSVACFCVRFSVTFHLTCGHIILVRFLKDSHNILRRTNDNYAKVS